MGTISSMCNSLMIFFSGYLSITEQAAWIICFDIMVFLYLANTGLAKTCCTIVGQYIGNGDIKTAKIYFKTFIIHGVINSTILNIFQYVFFYEMISIYTSIPEIQDQIMTVRLLFISHTWADLFKAILNYTVKALGIQSKGKYVNMIGQMII